LFVLYQLDIDFRLHYPDAVSLLLIEFTKLSPAIIAAARMSKKSDVVELLHDYDDSVSQTTTLRDHTYAILSLLKLLPCNDTRYKGKVSSVEMEESFIGFKAKQTSIELFLKSKTKNQKQPMLLCMGSKDDTEHADFYLILDLRAVSLGECGIIRALDALFKAHFIFWVDYAKPVSKLIEFLQKMVYKIEATKISARVRELHNSMLVLVKNAETPDEQCQSKQNIAGKIKDLLVVISELLTTAMLD